MGKDKTAQALVAKRWAKTTAAQRSEQMSALATEQAAQMTPAQRQARAKKASLAAAKARRAKARKKTQERNS